MRVRASYWTGFTGLIGGSGLLGFLGRRSWRRLDNVWDGLTEPTNVLSRHWDHYEKVSRKACPFRGREGSTRRRGIEEGAAACSVPAIAGVLMPSLSRKTLAKAASAEETYGKDAGGWSADGHAV